MDKDINKRAGLSTILFLLAALFFMISSVIYSFTNSSEWFSRLFLSLVCFGFASVIDILLGIKQKIDGKISKE